MYEAINQGDKDFSALVSKMKQANIDVIYFGGYQTEAGLIVRQSRDQGLKAPLIGGDALVTEEFWKITGPAGEGTLMTFAPDPRKVPAAKAVVDKFMTAELQPRGVHALHLRGDPGLRGGGREGQVDQARSAVASAAHDDRRHRHRQADLGQEGRHHRPEIRLLRLEGRQIRRDVGRLKPLSLWEREGPIAKRWRVRVFRRQRPHPPSGFRPQAPSPRGRGVWGFSPAVSSRRRA